MIKAMESGTGSISTTHAADAVARDRASWSPARWRPARTSPRTRRASSPRPIDLIVQLDLETTPLTDGTAAAAPVGRRDHRPHPGRAGEGLRRPRTSSAPHPGGAQPPPTSCPTSTGTWPGTGFDLRRLLRAAAPRRPRHDRR